MLHHEPPAPAYAPIDLAPAHQALRRLRVFLAEEDPSVRRLLAKMLREDGYEVLESADGSELLDRLATSLLEDGPFGRFDMDIIIADTCMPGCRGIDVLAGLRQAAWRTPVILMGGRPDARFRARARRLGVAAFLSKPIDLRRLHDALERVTRPC